MKDNELIRTLRKTVGILKGALVSILLLLVITVYAAYLYSPTTSYRSNTREMTAETNLVGTMNEVEVINGIHQRTGLIAGEGLESVVQNCTSCHSAKLITQNRMSKSGWLSSIRWMQETQGLWDLGNTEDLIVHYLATYYAPQDKGRRAKLTNIEWYQLD